MWTEAGRWASVLAARGADVVALERSRTALGDGWDGGGPWRQPGFWTLRGLRSLLQGAGFRVTGWRGAVFYPRSLACTRRLQSIEAVLSHRTTVGAAFIAVAGRYGTEPAHD